MQDDPFQLGNFSGLGSSDDGLDGELPTPPLPNQEREKAVEEQITRPEKSNQAVIRSVDGVGAKIINHPELKQNNQPIFKSLQTGQVLQEIGLDEIVPNEFQPRRVFNEEKLQELADSIKAHGIIQPLVVTRRPDGRYEIIVGERRFRASKLAGLYSVPAFIASKISSQTKLELALIENVQRSDLNPIEEAKAYERLRDEFKLGVGQIANRVGKDTSTVSNLLRLLRLPAEIQRALVSEEIAEGQARPLLSLRDPEEMLEMFYIIKKQGMKVREIEKRVRDIRDRQLKVKQMFTPDPFLESAENLLRNKLGTRVVINKKSKGGSISIEFYSDEELSDLVNRMS